MRIGVFGHVGNQNLGDEALIAAVIANVRRRYPDVELRGFTGHPRDTEQRHRIPAFPIRRTNGRSALAARPQLADSRARRRWAPAGAWAALRARLSRVPALHVLARAARRVGRGALAVLELRFLATSYGNLRGTDLLLIAGSGQLNDYWGGPWGFPFTLLKWSVLARLSGTKVAFLSVGAGPLQTRLGRFFIKQTLRLAHYRSYRDDDARRCITELGIPGEHPVVPDLVFSLRVADVPRAGVAMRPLTVGINPMPFFDDAYWPESDRRVYDDYLRTLASFVDWLVGTGYGVRFFPTQLAVDPGVIDQVRALMRQPGTATGSERVVADRITSLDQLIAVIDSLDVVVATRYHATLFGLIRHKPVLSIAYQRKSVELMAQLGQAQYAIEIDHLTPQALRERFLALERHSAKFTDTLRARLPAIRAVLEHQYDHAFALLPGSPTPRGAP